MKEIGKKFAKFGDKSLTELTKSITGTAEDLSPKLAVSKDFLVDEDKISLLTLNNSKVYIYSQKSAGVNLYKILNYIKPEKIYLQLRPDDIHFERPKLENAPQDLIPSISIYSETLSLLKTSGFLISESQNKLVTGKLNNHYDRLSMKTSVISAVWALQHNFKTLTLADIPRSTLYRALTSSVTLMQLQSMYSHIMTLIGAKPDSISIDEPNHPIILGYKLYPSI
jgi:hypothetical protein